MYNTSTMYENVYLLVVPRGFHNTWIKFHFDVQNNYYYQRMYDIQRISRWQSELHFVA